MDSLVPTLTDKLPPSSAGLRMNLQFSRTIQSLDSRAPASIGSAQTSARARSPILRRRWVSRSAANLQLWAVSDITIQLRRLQPRQVRRVHRDDSAQHTAGNHVADEMIIHRHKTHEHRSCENDDYDSHGSTAGHCDQPHGSKRQDSGSVAGRKTADVIATLKWMETVRPGADEP